MTSISQLPGPSVRPIVVVSHQRSGTHLLLDLLRRQFRECQSWKWPFENLNRLYLSFEALHLSTGRAAISPRKALKILARAKRPLVKMHHTHPQWNGPAHLSQTFHDSPWMEWLLGAGQMLYVVRHVADVMCSHYLMYTKNPKVGKLSISEFLRGHGRPISRVQLWVDHVNSWLPAENLIWLRFEDIVGDPVSALQRIGEFVGLRPLMRRPYLPPKMDSIWHSRWQRLFSIRPDCTAIIGLPKGVTRTPWQEALSEEDQAYIESIAGPLMRQLGYPPIRSGEATPECGQ